MCSGGGSGRIRSFVIFMRFWFDGMYVVVLVDFFFSGGRNMFGMFRVFGKFVVRRVRVIFILVFFFGILSGGGSFFSGVEVGGVVGMSIFVRFWVFSRGKRVLFFLVDFFGFFNWFFVVEFMGRFMVVEIVVVMVVSVSEGIFFGILVKFVEVFGVVVEFIMGYRIVSFVGWYLVCICDINL